MLHFIIESKNAGLVDEFYAQSLTDARVKTALSYKHKGIVKMNKNNTLSFETAYDKYTVRCLG